jgi:hypothetical protein
MRSAICPKATKPPPDDNRLIKIETKTPHEKMREPMDISFEGI